MSVKLVATLSLLVFTAAPAAAWAVDAPANIMQIDRVKARDTFQARCSGCHDQPSDRVPSRQALSAAGPDAIVNALTEGSMRPMAAGLSASDIEGIAVYLTGTMPLPRTAAGPDPNPCSTNDPVRITANSWNGWSLDGTNARYQPNPGLKAADLPRLKVKWTFAYPGSKNSQVTRVGDRLIFGSNAGKVYSLNAKSGCVYWRYDAKSSMRAAPVVAPLSISPSGYVVFITDDTASVNALDARTGKELWRTKVDTHPRARMTGAPQFYDGTLFVPIASHEELATNEPDYVCCTFVGGVAALDAKTGKLLWLTRTTPKTPAKFRTSRGHDLFGPAGGAIWSSPTIDRKRGLLYVTTGDSYTDVDHPGSDAVLAIELKSGKVRWVNQLLANDNFVVGCNGTENLSRNCPSPLGPDVDFGSSVILKTVGGKDILLAGQKSSAAYGLDPDTGKTLWTNKLGRGGAAGGIQWGMAADNDRLYVAVADPGANGKPQLSALDPKTGRTLWTTPAPVVPCREGARCVVSQSAPVTAIPGVVFSGAMDGHLRGYDPATGKIIWDFDTSADTYTSLQGAKVKGGALDATGPTIVDGMLYQHSGYPGVTFMSGGQNVLMAFSVDGR